MMFVTSGAAPESNTETPRAFPGLQYSIGRGSRREAEGRQNERQNGARKKAEGRQKGGRREEEERQKGGRMRCRREEEERQKALGNKLPRKILGSLFICATPQSVLIRSDSCQR